MSGVIHLNTAAFPQLSQAKVPVLLDFYADWCAPCGRMNPVVAQIADSLNEQAIIAKVNIDDEPGLASEFSVMSIPTFVVLKGGKIHARLVGMQTAETLLGALR